MLKRRLQLLRLLGDGDFHNLETLAAALSLAPQVLAEMIQLLRDDGVRIRHRNGTRFALDSAIEWLSEVRIRESLEPAAARCFSRIEVLDTVDSTNRWLAQCPPSKAGRATVCLAEAQSSGRGRLGRAWYSPPAVNLYLSLRWCFAAGPEVVQGLSLALGVAVAEACEALGVPEIGLKWPNDLVCEGGKLGGMLIELGRDEGRRDGSSVCAIIGIGINVNMSGLQARRIDQAATDLRTLKGGPVSRNQLASEVLNKAQQVLAGYVRDGLSPYRQRWLQRDVLRHRQVVISNGARDVTGTALGIDAHGAYLVQTPEGSVPVTAGTLRLSHQA